RQAGTYQVPRTAQSLSAAVGDFNEDGRLDLVVATEVPTRLTVLLGNGDGTLGKVVEVPVGSRSYASAVAVGDVDRDGHLDLVVTHFYDGTLSVLPGDGDGSFQYARVYEVASLPRSVAVADFNDDGWLDVATTGLRNGLSVLLNRGDGTLGIPTDYSVGILI